MMQSYPPGSLWAGFTFACLWPTLSENATVMGILLGNPLMQPA